MSIPKWVKAIPPSKAHGSGTLQKRLWKLVSDYVRIRDWYAFNGQCVATGQTIVHWTEGNAGHFKSYSKCNGLYKFNEMNIHLQSARSNSWGDRDDWNRYEQELKARYGDRFIEQIEEANRDTPLKFTTEQIIEKMRDIISKMESLPEQPAYYRRVVSLMGKD